MDDVHPLVQTDTSQANYDRLNKGRNMAKYRQYLRDQITELLTNYGKIDILWLDWTWGKDDKRGKHADDWDAVELVKMVRKLQPGIIVNNRLGLDDYEDGGDFVTPEQVSSAELAKYKGKTWETCQTFSGSWGYYRDEMSWKTHRQLLDLLITSAANGGNLILNVGPTARGEFDYRAKNALDSLAYWMHANSKAIYDCTYAPDDYKCPGDDKLTYNPRTKRLYIHLYDYPSDGRLVLTGYSGKVRYAQLLNDDSEVKIESAENSSDITLRLPAQKPKYEIPVVELILGP
jgi:alpha-L-fucosidase